MEIGLICDSYACQNNEWGLKFCEEVTELFSWNEGRLI